MTIDYRDLLKRYMYLVHCEESVTFVLYASNPKAPWLKFTPEEIAELEAIEDHGIPEYEHMGEVYYGRAKS